MATLTRASRSDSPALAGAPGQAGIDLTAGHGAVREMLRAAIAQRGGWIDWAVDSTGWVVTLYLPEERTFSGATLEDGLAACLTWLVGSASRAEIVSG